MPDLLYIHRRILEDESSTIVQQIHYTLTEEGLVDILKMTAHYVLDDGTLSANFFNDTESELTYSMKMYLLSILVDEGVIDIP
jgi:hypothetical protein